MNSIEHEGRIVSGDVLTQEKKYKVFLSLNAALNYVKWSSPKSFLVNEVVMADGTTKWELEYIHSRGNL